MESSAGRGGVQLTYFVGGFARAARVRDASLLFVGSHGGILRSIFAKIAKTIHIHIVDFQTLTRYTQELMLPTIGIT